MTAVLCSDTGSVQCIYIVSPLWWRQQTLSVLKPPISAATCKAKHLPNPHPPHPSPSPYPSLLPSLPFLTSYLPLPFSTSLQVCPLSFLSSHLLKNPLFFTSYLILGASPSCNYFIISYTFLHYYVIFSIPPSSFSKIILLVCSSVIFLYVAQRGVPPRVPGLDGNRIGA
jgi:hypothetical protein